MTAANLDVPIKAAHITKGSGLQGRRSGDRTGRLQVGSGSRQHRRSARRIGGAAPHAPPSPSMLNQLQISPLDLRLSIMAACWR